MADSYNELEAFIAERITKLRLQKDISARNMSLSIGLGEGYISHIENRKNMPSIQVLYYICDYLDISIKEFFDDETEEPVLISRIVKEIKKLDVKSLEQLLGFIKTVKSED